MMYDNQINVCEDILCGKEITDTDSAASAIERGYISRDNNGKLFVTVPAFTKEQYENFTCLVEKIFASFIDLYSSAVARYVDGYKKLFPMQLEDDVTRACNYMFLTIYATTICDMAKEKGLLASPSPGSVCDVLIQFK